MRKAAYFLLILLTGYVAGMYANPALMVLTAAQLLLAAGMAAQPRYFLRHLTFSAPRGTAVAEQGEACQVRLTVKNDGHMPVGRIRLEILGEFQKLTVTREKFTGACAQGETILQIPVSTEHCGILLSQAARVTVYDYLSLFRKKKKTDLSWKTLIFPGEYSLNLRFSDGGGDEGGEALEVSPLPAEGGYEIRQIREYREGDPIRHIHWNQTAKTDTLWILPPEDGDGDGAQEPVPGQS